MTYIIWQERGRKRGGRWEPKMLGTLEAGDAEAERLAAEHWPGLRLEVIANTGDDVPRSPQAGA